MDYDLIVIVVFKVEASCGNAHGSMACWLGTKCIGTIGIEMVQLGRRTKKLATV